MKRIVNFLLIVYIISAFGAWALFSKNTQTNVQLTQEISANKTEIASLKNALDAEKSNRAALEKKVSDAHANAAFLVLALCPTLEATDKNALCVKNNTEWFSQTLIAGAALTEPSVKPKMDELLVSLGNKKKPTAKQLYEMLRPIEVESLKALSESLK